MTEAYIRVKRDGVFKNIEIEYLTKDEREEYMSTLKPDELKNWIDLLCKNISELEEPIFEALDYEL